MPSLNRTVNPKEINNVMVIIDFNDDKKEIVEGDVGEKYPIPSQVLKTIPKTVLKM